MAARAASPDDPPRLTRRRGTTAGGELGNVRLEVSINGQCQCVAGVEATGVLAASLTWVLRPWDDQPGEIGFAVDGQLIGPKTVATSEAYGWLREKLTAGDEVLIRVLGPGPFDPAPEVRTATPPH